MSDRLTRRMVLRTVASLPLAFTFSLLASPAVRFLKPSHGPLNLVDKPDQPVAIKPIVTFDESQLSAPWTCLSFTFNQEFQQYSPGLTEKRRIPGFIVRLPDGDTVAYSRICPHLGCIFNFVEDPEECARKYNFRPPGPVFACPCHFSVYDIARGGKVISGPAPRPPYRFDTRRMAGGKIAVVALEPGSIA